MSLHAIEPTRLRRQHRVDGVGRPIFDFHTGAARVQRELTCAMCLNRYLLATFAELRSRFRCDLALGTKEAARATLRGVNCSGHDLVEYVPVWKSTSELGYLRNIAWTFVRLHAIEPTWPRGQCRVDGVESPRHRADAATESTSRRWRGAPEI